MPSYTKDIHRIIDANINRLKEGLRVCEEISRFILDNRKLSASFKRLRHNVEDALDKLPAPKSLIKERNASGDVGRKLYCRELKRSGIADIFYANIQRAKEAARVLEEFSKLINRQAALRFKEVRYKIYEIEKSASNKISKL